MTTTLTTDEQAGIEQFRASLSKSTPFQRQTTLASLQPGGSVERMKGAPRREVLDVMARILREYDAPAPAATPATPAAPDGYTRIKITGRDFGKSIKAAKSWGGRFEPETKTWLIPNRCPNLDNPAGYGWTIVK